MSNTAQVKYAKARKEDFEVISQFMYELEELMRLGFYHGQKLPEAANSGQPTASFVFHPARFVTSAGGDLVFDLEAYIRDRMGVVGLSWRPVVFSEKVVNAACDKSLDHLEWCPVLLAFMKLWPKDQNIHDFRLVYDCTGNHEALMEYRLPENCTASYEKHGLSPTDVALAWYISTVHCPVHGFSLTCHEHSTEFYLPVDGLSAVVMDNEVRLIGNDLLMVTNGIHFVETGKEEAQP